MMQVSQLTKRSQRFLMLERQPINQDGFVTEWPEMGFVAMSSPNDPNPSVKVENGKIVELDGKSRAGSFYRRLCDKREDNRKSHGDGRAGYRAYARGHSCSARRDC
ncbi:Dehydratase large subunit [Aneurinibacillus thermoaerophilus]|uniref:Dehydratase large subunit n=1 Tax=Aneurinibacillus thermoaerophilus TaxID=143495 RepID=A0A1G7WY93_ANETH|nr:Dehydratase large subunit [Aneurinibacillus thermoaerophilus]